MLGWWFALVGCVVAFDETVTIEAPVDRIAVEVAAGDVRVEAGGSEHVLLMGTFGGAGGRPLGYEVQDGLLTVSYDCRLCGGELVIEAPSEVGLELFLGAGDLTVENMAGLVTAEVNAGSAALLGHSGTTADLLADLGDARLEFVHPPTSVEVEMESGNLELELPGGSYNLDLRDSTGSVVPDEDEGVTHDPESINAVHAVVKLGAIEVHGR